MIRPVYIDYFLDTAICGLSMYYLLVVGCGTCILYKFADKFNTLIDAANYPQIGYSSICSVQDGLTES